MSGLNLIAMLDRLISQSKVVESGESKYVVKSFTGEKSSLKWLPVSALLSPIYPFAYNPKERLERELRFFSTRWESFRTPRIIEVDEENYTVKREYIYGRPLDMKLDARKLGLAVGEVHKKGWALGDTKPTNFLVGDDDVPCIIDAEQAIPDAEKHHIAWDLYLIFLTSSYVFVSSTRMFDEFIREFISSHGRECRCAEVYSELISARFGGLLILLPPSHLYRLVSAVENITQDLL
ncbi:MAG: hypothetical protein QW116_00170 [Zestosphaera sp.]